MKMMKTKFILFVALFVMGNTLISAQMSAEDCATTGSIFAESAKVKNYEAAFGPFLKLRKDCPKWSLALYQYGEKIYKTRIKNATGADKTNEANELIKLYNDRLSLYPLKTKKGDVLGDIGQTMYDNKIGTTQVQYDAFDKAQNEDPDNFTSPKQLYTYFNLAIKLQDAGQKPLQEIFDLYDVLINKIEGKESDMAKILAPLIEKQENGETLSSKEAKKMKGSEKNLVNYGKIKGSINTLLGQRADCENLVPLYEKDFENKKNDINWVRSAAGRLSKKDCDDPMFFKLVQELHRMEPSAKSAFYLGKLAEKDGDNKLALDYYNQSAELETNANDKAKVYYRIAESFRKKGNYGQARKYFRKALAEKPSMGICYLKIANMYGKSANNCGTDVFSKRAVNWLAADMASKAARVDPSIASTANATASSYRQRAPSRTDIFQENMAGKTVKMSCWIGGSIRVPSL